MILTVAKSRAPLSLRGMMREIGIWMIRVGTESGKDRRVRKGDTKATMKCDKYQINT
jgi:hypothetical protein